MLFQLAIAAQPIRPQELRCVAQIFAVPANIASASRSGARTELGLRAAIRVSRQSGIKAFDDMNLPEPERV